VWDRLVAAGSPRPVGYSALDSLRIEKGYRYLGTDLTAADTPYEAGLGFCVALDKPEFNGRDALVAVGEPSSRLRTLLVGGEDYLTIYGGEAVHAAGEVVGRVRSCAYGFTVRRNVALAKRPAALARGAAVEVEIFGRLVQAEIADDVLYDPEHHRVRA
jgi:glycine cleavage system aminomethyltransferase T